LSFKRRRIPAKLRATLGLIAIALASLWALSVSYDIPRAELLRFLLGSVLLLLAAMVVAVVLVGVLKGSAALLRKLSDK
jgi:peptidoglycan/LPS O-acetylase OafA/YrhL